MHTGDSLSDRFILGLSHAFCSPDIHFLSSPDGTRAHIFQPNAHHRSSKVAFSQACRGRARTIHKGHLRRYRRIACTFSYYYRLVRNRIMPHVQSGNCHIHPKAQPTADYSDVYPPDVHRPYDFLYLSWQLIFVTSTKKHYLCTWQKSLHFTNQHPLYFYTWLYSSRKVLLM